jgi:predicted RNA binding protein YcfA (HicA-like mRNA interferase family)
VINVPHYKCFSILLIIYTVILSFRNYYSITFLLENISKKVYHSMNGKEIISKLKAADWQLNRINGSHHIMVKDGKAVPVPVHGGRDVGVGLVATIARQTGVKLK